jgi:hypothetical protein
MYHRIKMGIIMVVAALSLAGCCNVIPCMPWCPPPVPPPPPPLEIEARLAIMKNRLVAESKVLAIKERFKGRETEAAYVEASDLYAKAMSENNAWLSVLTTSIENNENLAGIKSYENQSMVATNATEAFVKYGKEILGGKPSTGIVAANLPSKGLELSPIGDFITALVTNGITIYKANIELQAQQRKNKAEVIRKELKWEMWTEIGSK